MKIKFYGLFISITLSISILMIAQKAQAGLGETVESITKDSKALYAARRAATIRAGYTVQEIVSDANSVREYISPSGVVFAIAWNGLSHPDLTQLLGSYTGEYQQALRQAKRVPGQRQFQLKANSVIVEKWGHMRNLQGRAYAPALMPEGVNVNEIR